MSEERFTTICVPRHPDDADIPDSVIHLPLPSGRLVTIRAPICSKTMGMLHDTLLICKDAIVAKPEDYQI